MKLSAGKVRPARLQTYKAGTTVPDRMAVTVAMGRWMPVRMLCRANGAVSQDAESNRL